MVYSLDIGITETGLNSGISGHQFHSLTTNDAYSYSSSSRSLKKDGCNICNSVSLTTHYLLYYIGTARCLFLVDDIYGHLGIDIFNNKIWLLVRINLINDDANSCIIICGYDDKWRCWWCILAFVILSIFDKSL